MVIAQALSRLTCWRKLTTSASSSCARCSAAAAVPRAPSSCKSRAHSSVDEVRMPGLMVSDASMTLHTISGAGVLVACAAHVLQADKVLNLM